MPICGGGADLGPILECPKCLQPLVEADSFIHCGDCDISLCRWCIHSGRCPDCWQKYEDELDKPSDPE